MPVYQGKTASQWLDEFFTPDEANATEAFRRMGTNGTSFLVHELQRTNSPWERFYARNYPKLPWSVAVRLSPPMSDGGRWNEADYMLRELQAKSAIPDLIRVLPEKNVERQLHILSALEGLVGPENTNCIPPLINCLKSTNVDVQVEALNVLERIGPDKRAIPALTNLLHQSYVSPEPEALEYLSRIDLKLAQKYGFITLDQPPPKNSQPNLQEK